MELWAGSLEHRQLPLLPSQQQNLLDHRRAGLPSVFCVLLSFVIVAFAQPDWSRLSCFLAATGGYALFWRGMLFLKTKKSRFFLATLWFAAVEAFHLNWFLSDRYVGSYIYLVFLVLVLGLGVQFGAISVLIDLYKRVSIKPLHLWLGLSGGWVLMEWMRLFILTGFSWDPMGLTLTAYSAGLQSVSFVGIYGLSFWVFFINLWAVYLFSLPLQQFRWLRSLVWILVASTPYILGALSLAYHSYQMQKDPRLPLQALLVQPAITPEAKYPSPHPASLAPLVQWKQLLSLLAPYQNQPVDLILFSEAVVPYPKEALIYFAQEAVEAFSTLYPSIDIVSKPPPSRVNNRFWAQTLANAFNAEVVIGLEDIEWYPSGSKAYNAAFLFHPFSSASTRYEKQILVPMGEYIPFHWCKKLLSSYGITDSFIAGTEARLFPTKHALASVSICYEETYGHLMRSRRKQGAHLLLNLSNDVWYPESRLPIVHFFHGRLRAVEEGIPLLRACNTGVTCGVDSLGRMVGSLSAASAKQEASAAVLPISLPLYHYSTLYGWVGDWLSVMSSWVFVLSLLFCLVFNRIRNPVTPVY